MIHLSSFEAIHYRGIDGLSLPKLSRVNLITGANGVGKTALIEAIWLFMGRYHPRLLWSGTVQRLTNPTAIVNPVSELSGDSIELQGTDNEREGQWKVIFDHEPVEQFVPEPHRLGEDIEAPFAGRLQIWIDGEEIDAKSDSIYRTPKGTVLYKRPTPPSGKQSYAIIEGTRRQLETSKDDLKIYSDMVREGRKDDLANAVSFILPNIKDVQILMDENRESYFSAITNNGAQRPLEDLGGGVVRLLKLYLDFFGARNSLVLIDEVENGLHYSVLRDLWARIRTWTHEWNVQFIATTHSAECIDAAMEAFADEPNDLSIHNLFENESGNIKAATFTGEALEGARNLHLEVR